MMRRDIKKSFWVNSEEDRDIKAKSQAAGLTEAEFLRQRVKGYHPVVTPDEVLQSGYDRDHGGSHEMESFPEWYRTGDPHTEER